MISTSEAKGQYRTVWTSWCLCRDQRQKRALEQLMDDLQSRICEGPGPEWQAFAETLPGFLEFWDRLRVETEVTSEKIS